MSCYFLQKKKTIVYYTTYNDGWYRATIYLKIGHQNDTNILIILDSCANMTMVLRYGFFFIIITTVSKYSF